MTHTWTSRAGKSRSDETADLEWWFQRFSFLRNGLMHGEQPAEYDYVHDGERRLWLGEARLRQAIKRTVAGGGHPEVLMSPIERAVSDAADELGFSQGMPDGEAETS